MADNFVANPGAGGDTFAADEIAGVKFPRSKLGFGADGAYADVSDANRLPVDVSFPATQLVSGTVAVSNMAAQGLTDTQLRATPVPISGTVTANTGLTQPLTDAQLRATAVTVSEPALLLTGASAQTATVNNILEAVAGANGTNVSSYRSASVQVVSTGTAGTFIFEQSNDNTNWIALPVFNSALATAVPIVAAITASASAIIYTIPIRCRFLRLRIATTITGGSIQAFTRLSTEPWTASVTSIAQTTSTNLLAQVSGTVTANIGTGSLAAGVNLIGDVSMQVRNSSAGGASIHHIVAAASTNAASVKIAAGRLYGWSLANTTAAWVYVKLHNTNAAPTAGAGVVMTIGIPPNDYVTVTIPHGIGFTTGIGRTIVTGAADADATAVAANAVVGDLFFA
ncbi:MAG: hypothetical protein DDT26_00172 [Dehalococcoidia bacterium]|nr:hypothetical protein [Chloroflexota bacterium]